jgi:hypothetical protein
LEDHIAKHGQEENQKTIPEPFGGKPFGCFYITGAFSALGKKLTPAAIPVAEGFIAADDGNEQRHQEVDHTQPGKENIEKSQSEVNDCPDPEKIIPVVLFHFASLLSFTVMHPAGQALAHRPQPTHLASSTDA